MKRRLSVANLNSEEKLADVSTECSSRHQGKSLTDNLLFRYATANLVATEKKKTLDCDFLLPCLELLQGGGLLIKCGLCFPLSLKGLLQVSTYCLKPLTRYCGRKLKDTHSEDRRANGGR